MAGFNPNIPQPTDLLSQSQQDILANFQAIAPLFQGGVNQYVKLAQQTSQPTTSASQVALYSALDGSGNIQLFYGPKNTGTPVNLTGSIQSGAGYAYLPSGLILRWAPVGVTATSQTYVIPIGGGFPTFNNIFQVFLTPRDSSGNNNFRLGLTSINGSTSFTVWSQNPTTTTAMIYLIIGN